MKVGISTASLFRRYDTLSAIKRFELLGVECAEVFLESFSRYNKKYGKSINKAKAPPNGGAFHITLPRCARRSAHRRHLP